MNQEEQGKIYQLIQSEDINNWELAYQLIKGNSNRESAIYTMMGDLHKYSNDKRVGMRDWAGDKLRTEIESFITSIIHD